VRAQDAGSFCLQRPAVLYNSNYQALVQQLLRQQRMRQLALV
jgi:hypothetical protein